MPVNPGELFNNSVRRAQHVRRDRQADLLRGLEIDDELELVGCSTGKVGRLSAFENFVHVNGGAAVQIGDARPVRHQATDLHKLAFRVRR